MDKIATKKHVDMRLIATFATFATDVHTHPFQPATFKWCSHMLWKAGANASLECRAQSFFLLRLLLLLLYTTSLQKLVTGADRSPTVFAGRRTYADGRRRSPYSRHHGHVSVVIHVMRAHTLKSRADASLECRTQYCAFKNALDLFPTARGRSEGILKIGAP